MYILNSGTPRLAIASAQPNATVASSTAYSTVTEPRESTQKPDRARELVEVLVMR